MEWEAKILKVKDFLDEGQIRGRIVTLQAPENFLFTAGQFVMIAHESVKNRMNPKELRWASMSIASPEQQKESIELVISVGETTGITYFAANKRKAGETLRVQGPFGTFKVAEPYDELAMIACGTGLAPLMSMIRTKLAEGETKPITLFFGFRKMNQFLYKEEIEFLQQKHSNFQFFYITSRESTPTGKQGHVQELLKAHSFDTHQNIQFHVCGSPKALPEIIETLKALGFLEKQIHFEQW